MSKQRVTDQELGAILRDVEADSSPASEAGGYTFHRIQNGYPDGVPRAVFVHADEDPCGVPMPPASAPLLLLVGRLAADLQQTRDILRRIVTAWREDEIGQIDGALIEEAEGLLDIEPAPDPLAAESAEPAR